MMQTAGLISEYVTAGRLSAAADILSEAEIINPVLKPVAVTTEAVAELPGELPLKKSALARMLASPHVVDAFKAAAPSERQILERLAKRQSGENRRRDAMGSIAAGITRWDAVDTVMSLETVIEAGGLWSLYLRIGREYDHLPDVYSPLLDDIKSYHLERSRFRDHYFEYLSALRGNGPLPIPHTERIARGFAGPFTREGIVSYLGEKLLTREETGGCTYSDSLVQLLLFTRFFYLKHKCDTLIDNASSDALSERSCGHLLPSLMLAADFAIQVDLTFGVYVSPLDLKLHDHKTALDFEPVALMALSPHERSTERPAAPLHALLASFLYAVGRRSAANSIPYAANLYRAALKIFPLHPNALVELAHYEESERLLLAALEIDPRRVMVMEKLGDFYRRSGQIQAARYFYLRAIRISQEECTAATEGAKESKTLRLTAPVHYARFLELERDEVPYLRTRGTPQQIFEYFAERIRKKLSLNPLELPDAHIG